MNRSTNEVPFSNMASGKAAKLKLAFAAWLTVVCLAHYVQAQDWPIYDPPVTESVPQYESGYPLNAGANSPSSDANQPANASLNDVQQSPSDLEPNLSPGQIESLNHLPPNDFNLGNQSGSQTLKKSEQTSYDLNYTLQRDHSLFPVDPRKPCNTCTHPPQTKSCGKRDLPGVKGRPYRETEPGGCRCGKKTCSKCTMASVYWPRPLSAIQEQRNPQRAAMREMNCGRNCLVDAFDPLVNFKLINYQRRDSGYCGRGSDPYGCLGESKQVPGRVIGVGYRNPGDPAAIPAPFNR